MNKDDNMKFIISAGGISYFVTKDTDTTILRPFGIQASLDADKSDMHSIKNLFFTFEEAAAYCKFLAENEVYPYTLEEVLSNILVL